VAELDDAREEYSQLPQLEARLGVCFLLRLGPDDKPGIHNGLSIQRLPPGPFCVR
jgi:hypothetical protein